MDLHDLPCNNPMKICVLIPAYNEEKTIRSVVSEAAENVEAVIVVDDGSSDGTAEEARRGGAVVISHGENRGKGAALKTGFRHALEKGFEGVIVMDADGQHKPADISAFLERAAVSSAGIILGNRMEDTKKMPLIRYLTNRFTSAVVSRMACQRITDSQCGFRFIRCSFLRDVELKTGKFETETEMLIAAARAGCGIDSVRISTIYGREKSKINPVVDTLRFLRLVLACRRVPGDRR